MRSLLTFAACVPFVLLYLYYPLLVAKRPAETVYPVYHEWQLMVLNRTTKKMAEPGKDGVYRFPVGTKVSVIVAYRQPSEDCTAIVENFGHDGYVFCPGKTLCFIPVLYQGPGKTCVRVVSRLKNYNEYITIKWFRARPAVRLPTHGRRNSFRTVIY